MELNKIIDVGKCLDVIAEIVSVKPQSADPTHDAEVALADIRKQAIIFK